MKLENYSENYFGDIKDALTRLTATDKEGRFLNIDSALREWIDVCENKRKENGIFFFCGNGASATMAEHMSHDCFQNLGFLTQTCSETSHLTAIANDISFEEVFAFRIERMLGEKDMLIAISSSGNSPDIVRAIEAARKKGAFVVSISGKQKDNAIRQSGDLNFYVPLNTYGMVESAHAVLLHCWIDMYLDNYGEGRH